MWEGDDPLLDGSATYGSLGGKHPKGQPAVADDPNKPKGTKESFGPPDATPIYKEPLVKPFSVDFGFQNIFSQGRTAREKKRRQRAPADPPRQEANGEPPGRSLSAADIAAIAEAISGAIRHVFTWKNAFSAACLAASEYAMLSLIEDAPRSIKLATLIVPLLAFLTIQFEARLRKIHNDVYPIILVLLLVGYVGFGSYIIFLTPYGAAPHGEVQQPLAPPSATGSAPKPSELSQLGLPRAKMIFAAISPVKFPGKSINRFNIQINSTGNLAALKPIAQVKGKFVDQKLSADEENVEMNSLVDKVKELGKLKNITGEIDVGQSAIITLSDLTATDEEWNEVINGKRLLYVFFASTYLDEAIEGKGYWRTEYCMYFTVVTTYWHNCARSFSTTRVAGER